MGRSRSTLGHAKSESLGGGAALVVQRQVWSVGVGKDRHGETSV